MRKARISDDAIDRANIEADLPQIVSRYTRLTRQGKKYEGLCPFHREKTPSFGLFPRKNGGGWGWKCLGACNEGGDAVSFVMRAEGVDFPAALERLGVDRPVTEEDRERIRQREFALAREATELERRLVAAARTIWKNAVDLAGTAAETYLTEARGLRGPFPPTLRFVPSLKHKEDGREFPAMVAVMQDAAGEFRGIHRTYLAPDGRGKAELQKGAAKKMLGAAQNAHVRFDPIVPAMLLGEGIESSLAVRQATGRPTLAALSLSNLGCDLPGAIREITLCVDSDEKIPEQAEIAKQKALAAHRARRTRVGLARPPAGMDFNDLLNVGAG